MLLGISACSSSDEHRGAPLQGTVSLEIRDHVTMAMGAKGTPPNINVIITPSASYGLLPKNQALAATSGRIETFPEANARLYTAKFDAPAQPDGPCGEQPISLALSLHRQGSNDTVIGGLTAYCGEGVFTGRPVRVLRIAGPLSSAPP